MTFSEKILQWYDENKRDLPWRATRNPYNIWLSEVILQQTRIVQGTPYYLRFIENFPTVQDLAKAPEEKVLKLWQGLGYYSRARNLHATAKMVVDEYGGQFPDSYKELLKLKGVGDYTASAISSICFDERQPVVDGNVYRVLARYFGIDTPINSTEGVKQFKSLARDMMHLDNIRDYNQGIMEFGAIQCAPKKPYCLHCPLHANCQALQQGLVAQLPVKLKKTKVRDRYFNYFVVHDSRDQTVLNQRTGKGIWQNLWEFPLLESDKRSTHNEVPQRLQEVLPLKNVIELYRFNEKPIVHKLSHQHLHSYFWIAKVNGEMEEGIPWKEIDQYPVPVLIADFIKTFKNLYF